MNVIEVHDMKDTKNKLKRKLEKRKKFHKLQYQSMNKRKNKSEKLPNSKLKIETLTTLMAAKFKLNLLSQI